MTFALRRGLDVRNHRGDVEIMRYELRRQDFSLADYQLALRDSFIHFFNKECPIGVVRDAEPLGYAPDLWKRLVRTGITTMGLPHSYGGDESALVDLGVIAEEAGRVMAPVPMISHVVASRLLGRACAPRALVEDAASGDRVFALAPAPVRGRQRQLVSEAALTRDVIGLDDEQLVLFTSAAPAAHIVNQAGLAIGWWEPSAVVTRTVLAVGDSATAAYRTAISEWKVLTAAALVGLAEAALHAAVEFAKTRETMGVPIGALQGVAFPLADVAIGIAGARNLAMKSAWMLEHEPESHPELPLMAYAYAGEIAARGTSTSAHMQGGLGVSTESVAAMYFVRAAGWAALCGGRLADYQTIAREIADPR
jgi:alkylation response protein AidB-like acyl-CoA dehydrogenase